MFSDDDIAAEVRTQFSRGGVANYAHVGEYGRRDASGQGIEGHKARLKRENDERLSLAHVATSKFQSRMRWSK